MIERVPQMVLLPGILSAAILLFVSSAPVPAAEDYPSRPIRIIVPFAPGGGTDMVARVIAPKLSERLGGTTVIVDNRGGAGAIIGTAIAAKATPDGYTLLVCDTAHTIQPVLQKLEYDPIKSFSLIASLVNGDNMLVSPASLPAKTVQEFVALAKQKPGQLVAGTAGACRQPQMREYPDNHRRFFDGNDDLQLAAALRAVFKVDIEYPLEQARPAHARRRAVRVFVPRRAGILRCARHNRGA